MYGNKHWLLYTPTCPGQWNWFMTKGTEVQSVGWLYKEVLVATDMTSFPLTKDQFYTVSNGSIQLTWSGWRDVQYYCNTSQPHTALQCINSQCCLYSAQSHLIAYTCFCWNHKCFTWGGGKAHKHSQITIGIYATLMRFNKVKTAVSGSSIFVCWMTGEMTGCRK